MKNSLKLTSEYAKNTQYGRQIYIQAINREYRNCVNALRDAESMDARKKFFTAKLLKNRFRDVCKVIKDDFRKKYNSSYDTNYLNDKIMEKSIMLDNMIAVKML